MKSSINNKPFNNNKLKPLHNNMITPFDNFKLHQNVKNEKIEILKYSNRAKPFENFELTFQDTYNDNDRLSLDGIDIPAEIEDLLSEDEVLEKDRLSLEDLEITNSLEIDFSNNKIDSVLNDELDYSLEENRLSLEDLEVGLDDSDILSDNDINEILNDDLGTAEDDRLSLEDLDINPIEDEIIIDESASAFKEINSLKPTLKNKLDKHTDLNSNLIDAKGDPQEVIKKDLEQKELLSQNLFSYEDDGNEQSEFKESDLNWPAKELQNEDRQELKDVLLYLDQLFGNLPEGVIKDFAKSPYYDKYNNLLDKLEI
ncbi:MAG: hypothetical protein OEV44_15370 [Spirochaetota bacterium]|nr:hypothetical protein [Spirochaetota bacterium]